MNNFSTLNVNSNCDVSTIFAGGGPPDAGAEVKVGGKQLIPSPFINLSLEKYKVGDLTIGGVLKLTLNGTVTGSSFNEVVTTGAGGATGLKDILQIGQYKECVYVEVKCSDSIVKGYGRVTGLNISEGNMPSWVNMAPYSIEIDLYTNDIGLSLQERPAYPGQIEEFSSTLNSLMLKNISESFSINIGEETFNFVDGLDAPTQLSAWGDFGGWGNRHLKLNFNISAVGIRALNCEGGTETTYKYGLEAAELYIRDRINKLRSMDVAGLFSSPSAELETAFSEFRSGKAYLDFRTLEVNPLEDSLSLNGEIIYRPSGCNSAIEDNVFTTLNVEQSLDSEGETITLNGNIQGLVNNSFDKIIKMSTSPTNWSITNCSSYQGKILAAETFLQKFAKLDNLLSIAQWYYDNTGFFDDPTDPGYIKDTCPLSAEADDPCSSTSPSPSVSDEPKLCDLRLTSSQINRNLPEGEINFTFVLSNKANCNVLGARKVDVEVTHDIPHDNIVEILIPGRGDKGVITQNLCCKSVEKYDANINITLNRNNCNQSMTSQKIEDLRKCAEQILKDKLDPNIVNCWFITNYQETDGNNTYRLSKTYVKPSCDEP